MLNVGGEALLLELLELCVGILARWWSRSWMACSEQSVEELSMQCGSLLSQVKVWVWWWTVHCLLTGPGGPVGRWEEGMRYWRTPCLSWL